MVQDSEQSQYIAGKDTEQAQCMLQFKTVNKQKSRAVEESEQAKCTHRGRGVTASLSWHLKVISAKRKSTIQEDAQLPQPDMPGPSRPGAS